MQKRVLIVDDDVHMRTSIVEVLRRRGNLELVECKSGYEALDGFKQGCYDLIISDVKMPGMSGVDLLAEVRKIDTNIPFVIMTAFGDVALAVDAMKQGAYDFIEKGMDLLDKLEFAVDRALQHSTLVTENRRLKKALSKQWNYIGETEDISKIRKLISNIAQSRATVLIMGESGTGKELAARSIHYISDRRDGPFVKINCAALPEGLIESELFGHEKGAFTGAIKSKKGKFELASGGTLLLDEIGEMPLSVQAKLLRVLQEREVDKVGGDLPVEVDVRIVATTNRDLESEVSEGNFREDLFFRLNVFKINLPKLADRIDDIPALVDHFIEKFNNDNGFAVEGIDNDALQMLMRYNWPGNIRELENTIERAVVLTNSGNISKSAISLNSSRLSKSDGLSAGMTVAEAERELIYKTMEFCSQNKTKAAEMLDISIRTLRNKLNEYEKASM